MRNILILTYIFINFHFDRNIKVRKNDKFRLLTTICYFFKNFNPSHILEASSKIQEPRLVLLKKNFTENWKYNTKTKIFFGRFSVKFNLFTVIWISTLFQILRNLILLNSARLKSDLPTSHSVEIHIYHDIPWRLLAIRAL
jgi:hypothetical protein